MFSCKLHFAVCNIMLLTALLSSNDKTADGNSFPCLNFGSHRFRHSAKSIMEKQCQKVTGYLVSKLRYFPSDKTPQVQDAPCN